MYPSYELGNSDDNLILSGTVGDSELLSDVLACPKFKTSLKEINGMLFSPEALTVYPIIGGIPCLRVEKGVFASKYEEVMNVKG